ncbi:KxYKxGKxW signal peptide domain-containing protein, partial [Lactobacillus sp.]|uniref:KxYKxGKxW signal peptide domain-containing protein n=1 Tax=Lactobacillus sp. TaxID=1591 RepID=UPI002588AC75
MKNKFNNSLLMNKKVHYKMYKKGKSWLIAGIVTIGFGLSFALEFSSAKADTTANVESTISNSDTNLPQLEGTQTSKKISTLASELMFAQALEADDYTPQSDFTWQYNEDGTAYMKVFTGNQSIVNIPPTIVNPKDGKTYTVTRIDGNYGNSGWGSEAPTGACLNGLINNPNITSLTIPGTVKTLYAGTIGTLPNLVSFKLSEGVTTISQSIKELGPGPNDFWEIFWNSRKLTYLYLPSTLKNFVNPNNIINTLIGRSTSPLTKLTNVDFVFNNFNHLYADYGGSSPTPLTDFKDINYYIPDEQGYLDDPDIVQWTKADGTRLPVTMSEFQNASYDANTKKFKINPGKTSIKYRVTIDLSSLNKPNETMNITLPIFRGNINVKDSEYSVGDTFSAKNNYVNGLNADGNNLAWNDPAVKAEVTDSHGNPVALDQITQHDGEYNIKYIYTYGFNQKKFTSQSAKIRVKQVNNIKVSLVATNTGTTLVTDKKAEGEPRTEDVLDLGPNSTFLNSIIPAGYHYARSNEELNGHTQPVSPKYGPIDQSLTVYVVGDLIKPGDHNAVTVHHYLKDTTTLVPGMSDVHRGGRVGDTLTFNLTDPEQVAPAGYKLVEGQQNQSWTLQHDQGKVINFYYEALIQDNITIDFVDVNTDETVIAKKPGGTHHTGEELDLNSTDVTSKIPAGYHIAKGSELNGKTQPSNPKYTTEDQTIKVFIVGDKIADDATNAVTVHHYFKDTTTPVPGMSDVHKGGRVGETLKFKLTDPEQKAPDGYELSAGQTDQEWTLKHDEGKTIIFYYEAKTQDNITIKFGDAMNPGKVIGTTKPTGHRTGDTLDLSSDEVISKVPKGYHVATKDELKD